MRWGVQDLCCGAPWGNMAFLDDSEPPFGA